jgi:hypothetical protein
MHGGSAHLAQQRRRVPWNEPSCATMRGEGGRL